MKKVLLVAVVGALPFMTASADQSVVTVHEEPMVVNEPAVVESAEPAPIEEEAYVCPLNGFYGSLGIGGSFYKNKMDDCDIDVFGVNLVAKPKKQSINRFIGVALIGYGRVLRDVMYVGVEGGLDFSGVKKKNVEADFFVNGQRVGGFNEDLPGVGNRVNARTKTSAISPFLAIRCGYFYRPLEALFYVKAGVSHMYTKFSTDATAAGVRVANLSGEKSDSRICPLVALGVEKAFAKKFSARVEAEYRFGLKKHSVKLSNGFNVRAVVSYHLNGI
jgi:opacity protein-like surface antigen